LGAWWTLPIIGNGLGPGGTGKDEVDLRRVMKYTPTSNPATAAYVAGYMAIELGRIDKLMD
jgi:hypothetical protein